MPMLTLQQLALNQTCLHLFNHSPLPSLIANITYKYRNKYMDHEMKDIKEFQKNSDEAIANIEESLIKSGKVPPKLREKILSAVVFLDNEISELAGSLARNMTTKTLKNIRFCLKHIVITHKLTVDFTESVLNIFRMSKFDIKFARNYLARNCIKRSQVKKVYLQICQEIEAAQNSSEIVPKRTQRSKVTSAKMEKAHDYIEDMMTGKKFWDKRRHKDGYRDENNNLMYATDMQYVAVMGGIDALSYYYENACKQLAGLDREKHVYDCAEFIFLLGSYSAEKINFFYERLNPASWKQLLDDNFELIFLTYLNNWYYRDCCLPLFYQFKDTFEKSNVEFIWRETAYKIIDPKNCYSIMTILKEIWKEIPSSWKMDSVFTHNYIPLLLASSLNFSFFNFFLEDYTADIQADIIGRIVFHMMSTSQEDQMGALIRNSKELGLMQSEGKEFITKDVFKDCIIFDVEKSQKTDFDKVTKYICNSKLEEKEYKKELLKDRHFIADLFVNDQYNSIKPFLDWVVDADDTSEIENEILAFKKTLDGDLIQDIYERRLIQHGDYSAEKIFTSLKVNSDLCDEIRNQVTDNTLVLHWFFQSCFNDIYFSPLASFFRIHSVDKEKAGILIEEFLYAPETIEAVLDKVLDLPDFVLSFKNPKNGAGLMLKWLNFIKSFVKPYTDIETYKNLVLGDIELVHSEMYEKVKKHPKFGRLDDAFIKHIIKTKVTCFTAIFDNSDEFLEISLQNRLLFDMTVSRPYLTYVAERL